MKVVAMHTQKVYLYGYCLVVTRLDKINIYTCLGSHLLASSYNHHTSTNNCAGGVYTNNCVGGWACPWFLLQWITEIATGIFYSVCVCVECLWVKMVLCNFWNLLTIHFTLQMCKREHIAPVHSLCVIICTYACIMCVHDADMKVSGVGRVLQY